MDRREIEAALADLGAELERRRVQAKLWVVGGAAMVLAFGSRDATRDVDGTAYPAERVFEAARDVASRHGLPDDWLNDHAAAFMPVVERETSWLPVRRFGTLEVFVADARMMLAMKLRASRGSRDDSDIGVLLHACRVTTEAEALGIYEEYFPQDPMPRPHRAALRRILAELAAAPGPVAGGSDDPGGGGFASRADLVQPGAGRARSPRAPDESENAVLWVSSPRGSVSHRIGRADGDEVITACGQRLPLAELRAGRSPKKRPCDRCVARRPDTRALPVTG